MMNERQKEIFDAIAEEREAQDKQWGCPYHDDMHTANDWIVIIFRSLAKAACFDHFRPRDFRHRMIQVAAVAVAAVEAVDRYVARHEGAYPDVKSGGRR
jgi:hypothetical protein